MRTRHWKKLIGLIGLFIVFFALTALCASAETEGIFTYTVVNDEVIITKVDYTGVSDVVIPETIAGYPVTKLESDFLMDNDNTRGNSLKILSGILIPDSGNVVIDRKVPWKNRKQYVKNIGVVFGQRSQLWWDIPAIDSFNLLKDIYELKENEYNETLNELIDLLNLKDIINIPVRQLSLGNRMRCEIAAALIHRPKILFLDEPTIGLDAVSKKTVRDFIKKINKKDNVTIILTTHDMSDIEALAERIILIGKGKVLYDGTLKKLKTNYDYLRKVIIKTNDRIKINKDYIVSTQTKNGEIEFIIDIRKIELSKFIKLISSEISIIDINVDNENIDEIIIKLYKDFKI